MANTGSAAFPHQSVRKRLQKEKNSDHATRFRSPVYTRDA